MANNYILFSETYPVKDEQLMRKIIGDIEKKDDCATSFEYRFEDGNMIAYSEDGSDVDQLARALQKYMRKTKINDMWFIEFCWMCDRPLLGEFGGGVVSITPKRLLQQDTAGIRLSLQSRFEKQKSKKKT